MSSGTPPGEETSLCPTTPDSLSDLHALPWQNFERLVTGVLSKYYSDFGVTVRSTQLSKDGGRDGEGVIVLGTCDGWDLSLSLKLWIEVKKRGEKRNLGLQDLAKTLLRAENENVTKLIFVTNQDYTTEAREEIERYSYRHRLAHTLLTGADFLKIAQALPRYDSGSGGQNNALLKSNGPQETRDQATEVEVHVFFSPDPLRYGKSLRYTDINLAHSAPIFLFVELAVTAAERPTAASIQASAKEDPRLEVFPYESLTDEALAAGDTLRKIFVIWMKEEGILTAEDIDLQVVSKSPLHCLITGTNSVRINRQLLDAWTPPSRERILSRFVRNLERWLQAPAFESTVIVASAGVGKSHLLAQLRVQWLKRRVLEVAIDGEVDRSDLEIVDRVFRYVFPVSLGLFGKQHLSLVKDWLTSAGMNSQIAEELARSITARRRFDPTQFDSRSLGELLAVLLSRFAAGNPLVFVYEDLHKAHPSALTLLLETHRYLRHLRRSHVYFIATTRNYSIAGDAGTRGQWRKEIENFLNASEASQIELSSLDPTESEQLILKTIPTLERADVFAIQEQIGTTPLAIREALAFLIDTQIAAYDPKLAEYIVIHPERLRNAIRIKNFTQATKLRLQALRERYSPWLGSFLDAGACLGRDFPLDIALEVSEVPTIDTLEMALRHCEQTDVLRPSPLDAGLIRFDHDLVRYATLDSLSAMRHRSIARTLFSRLGEESDLRVQASVAYQAGLPEICLMHAMQIASHSRNRQCYADSLSGLELAIACLDPDTLSRSLPGGGAGFSWITDEAIISAPSCQIEDISREERLRRLLPLLENSLECYTAIGSGSSVAVDKIVTEGLLVARHLRDTRSAGRFRYHYGQMLFERNRVEAAAKEHIEAERLAASTKGARSDGSRALNLVRLAICERQLGKHEISLSTLRRALSHRGEMRWNLLVRVLSNYGAAFLYSDWKRVRKFWERALSVAKRHSLDERVVHTLIDVGYLDLLEGKLEAARSRLEQAGRIAESKRYENSLLRVNLNLACLDLEEGEFESALRRLLNAEELAILHMIGRRLWRIRANLATTYEAMGDLKRSYIRDRSVIETLGKTHNSDGPKKNMSSLVKKREILAISNIRLRANSLSTHKDLLLGLEPELHRAASEIAEGVTSGHLETLPSNFGKHCRSISNRLRFIITE